MMNKFKKIIASVLAVATIGTFSTAAFAGALVEETDFYQFYAVVNGTPKANETFTVDVFVKTADGSSISLDFNEDWSGAGCFASSGLRFDKNIVTINSTPTYVFEGMTVASAPSATGYDEITFASDLEIDSDSKLVTYQFTVKDGVEAGTYTNNAVWVGEGASLSDDYMAYELYSSIDTADAPDTVLVVKGDEPVGPTATGTAAANGANTTTYTFENSDAMAGKKVIMQNAKMSTTGMTADTRFIVSDGTRTQIFGSDIWAKLGAEGDGVIDVDNVIFGIIVDAANTSTFTFEVK